MTLRSPASPPTVVPGGPATPPARRDPVPAPLVDAAPATTDEDDLDIDGEPDRRGPRGHVRDGHPQRPRRHEARARRRGHGRGAAGDGRPAAWRHGGGRRGPVEPVEGRGPGPGRSPGSPSPCSSGPTASSTAGAAPPPAAAGRLGLGAPAPTVDLAKVGTLMEALSADPADVETLLALGDEYYNGGEFDDGGRLVRQDARRSTPTTSRRSWPAARSTSTSATPPRPRRRWKKVLALEPENVEA